MKTSEMTNDKIGQMDWLGEVVDILDPLEKGRVRVKVFGKFDKLEDAQIPWASPSGFMTSAGSATGSGQFSLPKIGSIVNVQFENSNLYTPIYTYIQHLSEELSAEITGDNYTTAQVLMYDTEVEGGLKIFYTIEKGLMIDYNSSQINIRPDNTIYLEHAGGKVIHLQEKHISIGTETTSDEPAVLGDKNVEALKALSAQIDTLSDNLLTFCGTQITASSAVPLTAGLAPGYTTLTAEVSAIKASLLAIGKKEIPQTRSNTVSVDGPSKS